MHGDRAGKLCGVPEETVGPLVLVIRDGDGNGLRVKQMVQEDFLLRLAGGDVEREVGRGGIHTAGNRKLLGGFDASGQDRTVFQRHGCDVAGNHGVGQRPSRLHKNGVVVPEVLV